MNRRRFFFGCGKRFCSPRIYSERKGHLSNSEVKATDGKPVNASKK